MKYKVTEIYIGRLGLTEAHITKIVDSKSIKFKTWDYEIRDWHSNGSESMLNIENFEFMYPEKRTEGLHP